MYIVITACTFYIQKRIFSKCGTKFWYQSLCLKRGTFYGCEKKISRENCMNNMAEKTVKIIGSPTHEYYANIMMNIFLALGHLKEAEYESAR